ncbi:MAG: hypothetical protein IH600_07515 [Bacteroidetes bacterium]|nr:hypothetical protein [Bacteroidota bacterium]
MIDIGADGITAVTGYYDSRAIPEQLGLQVLVQPFTVTAEEPLPESIRSTWLAESTSQSWNKMT